MSRILAAVLNGQEGMRVMFGGKDAKSFKGTQPHDLLPDFQKPPVAVAVASPIPGPELVGKKIRAYAEGRAAQSRKAAEAKSKKPRGKR
jgi:hypothetical protein